MFAADRLANLPRLVAGLAAVLGPAALRPSRRRRARNARELERRLAQRAVRWLQVDIETAGLEHIDRQERYVITPLHEGFADVLAVLRLPLDLTFVAREELREWRTLGRALSAGDHLTVDPEAGVLAYRRMLRDAREVFARGESLVVFPQGSVLGIESGFAAGAFRIAAALRRPVLPVVLSGSHRVWDYPFDPVVHFGQRISMEVLPPVLPSEAVAKSRALERRMKRLALSAPSPPRRFVPERDGWWDGYRFTIDADFPALAARVAERRREMPPVERAPAA
jgi:1-acyl-sn-glycerol-3-phosphate acyltransferase